MVPIGTISNQESIMRNAYPTTAAAIGAASLVVLSSLVSIGAGAATGGSTDMYARDGFATAFGVVANEPTQLVKSNYSGSTDTWDANSFRASFGPGGSFVQSTNACRGASTDVWDVNGILASFGPLASRGAADLLQACQGAGPVLR